MLIRGAALGLALILNVLLARRLGPAQYGTYSYGLSLVNIIGVLGMFGLDQLLMRNLAAYTAQADWAHLRGFARWATLLTLILLIGIVMLSLVFWQLFAHELTPLWQTALIAVIAITPVLVLVRLSQSILQGLQHPIASQTIEIIWQTAAIVLIGSAPYWLSTSTLNAELAVWLRSAALACAAIIAGVFIYRAHAHTLAPATPRYQSRIWLRSALYLLAAGALTTLYSQLDILMLGWLTDATQVSIYAAASKGALLVGLVLPSANLVLAPRFTALFVTDDLAQLQRQITRSARLILLATTPICLLMILAGRWFLSIFGPAFVQGHIALVILSIGQWINVAMGSVALLLMLSGYEREVVIGLGISVVASVASNYILIPIWGIEGAAVATTLAIIIWNVILYGFVRQRLGLAPSVLGGTQIQRRFSHHTHKVD